MNLLGEIVGVLCVCVGMVTAAYFAAYAATRCYYSYKRRKTKTNEGENMTEPTICVMCQHFKNREPGSARADVWYNHVCTAPPLPPQVFNYVTGKLEPQEYPNCRERNPDGKCQWFEG